jgi:hypothetical protein
LELPALGKLLAHATVADQETHDNPYLRTLPHERWLARLAGLDEEAIPTAPFMRLADHGGKKADGLGWACLQPVHIHAARDHLVLFNPHALAVTPDESAALLASVAPLLAEQDIVLDAPRPDRWYLPATVFGPLDAAPPQRAVGRNIDVWMQSGERARAWRRLQNEMQMMWHDHPVNVAREADGRIAINSVWLHGTGQLQAVPKFADRMWADGAFPRGLALHAGIALDPLPAWHPSVDGRVLAIDERAADAYLNADWALWLDAMRALEAAWFVPALAAMQAGTLDRLNLVLASDSHHITFSVARGDLRKFWRRWGAGNDWRATLAAIGAPA